MGTPDIPEAQTAWQAIGAIAVGVAWGGSWLLKFLAGRKEPISSTMAIQEAYSTSSRPLEASAERCAIATEKTAKLIETLLEERAAERSAHDRDKVEDERRALRQMIEEIKKNNPPARMDRADDERQHMREMMDELLKRSHPRG